MAFGSRVCTLNMLCIDNHYLVHLNSASIKSSENQAVIRILLKEVKGLNPSFEAHDIRGKGYLSYKYMCLTTYI